MSDQDVQDRGEPGETSRDLRTIVARIAGIIARELSPGEVAALRRLAPDEPYAPAVWKVFAMALDEVVPPDGPAREEAERRWAAILCGLAITQGLHRAGRPLGAALASAGFSELRFTRLLRARGDQMFAALRGAAQYLASKALSFDALDLARLVLSEDGPREERTRRDIARSYYRQLA
jgi:CRISPR system Cascade subunit CasB